jgi:hypothetical protein
LERLRITLEIAGFSREDIEVTQEESQLWIRGRQREDKSRDYVHRGIAVRQFQRNFLLAEGMQVLGANLAEGLLSIDVAKPAPDRTVMRRARELKDVANSKVVEAPNQEEYLSASEEGAFATPWARESHAEMAEVITRVSGWAGGSEKAMAWYRGQPISAFGDRTAESLVNSGLAAPLRDYLDSIALGGFA